MDRDYRAELDRETERRAAERAAGVFNTDNTDWLRERKVSIEQRISRKDAKILALSRGLNEPDYAAGCGYSGTDLSAHPTPYLRKWPNARKKRRVTVTQTVFYGIGHHTYVTLREEDNPIWSMEPDPIGDSKLLKGRWIEPWKDTEGDGLQISERCLTALDAARWIRNTFAALFSEKTHMLVHEHGERKWFYKDGD